MIVPMKKVTLLCLAGEREKTLKSLRELGVVHLAHIQEPAGDDVDDINASIRSAEGAINALKSINPEKPHSANMPGGEAIDEVNKLILLKKELQESLEQLETERARIEPFGDFDPASVKQLAEKGITVRLYHTTEKGPVQLPQYTQGHVIREDKAGRHFVIIGQHDFDFKGTNIPLPERRLADISADIAGTRKKISAIDQQLESLTPDVPAMEETVQYLRHKKLYAEARAGMGESQHVAYLRGYSPADSIDELVTAADSNGWGLVHEEPGPDDNIPTLVRYPGWVKVMKPVFAFLGITPGYREADISSAFFLFLTVFFAMIVGDAGYGTLFLLAMLTCGRVRMQKSNPETFRLMVVFSAATMAWGVLTGNYFGINYELLPGVLQSLRIDWLVDQNHSMTFSIILGALHLTLAHLWKAIRAGADPRALVQLGWICIVWSVFCIAQNLLVKSPIPAWFLPLLGTGTATLLVGLIASRQWMDLGLLALDLVSCFGDLMSYLRLFALGIASVKVAEACNSMAYGLGIWLNEVISGHMAWMGVVLAVLLVPLVLLIGHGLNIILCAMSVLVHGIRLNALEFSLHMGLEWSGFEYNPFRKEELVKSDVIA